MTKEELQQIINSDESFRIERTVSTTNMDKFQEAICAFANDLPGSRKKGYLLIGVNDDGSLAGLRVDDALMIKISNIRSDGNILPLPVMTTEKIAMDGGDVLMVEVTPSFNTPVRYRGRTFIRIGPRRDVASMEEERILSERCAASLPTFDTHPCREATIEDLNLDVIEHEYLPQAIDSSVLEKDRRSLKEQMASLHLYNMSHDCPTYAALIMFGKEPKYFMPGCYIQYVRFQGDNNGGTILNERRFDGNLFQMLIRLESFIRDAVVTQQPVPASILKERPVVNYPYKVLRELLMNAVMHRDYQSNEPIRFYQYDHKISIRNAGGLYGEARPENFPHMSDYRNSVVADMMRTLNYVNMFNHGILESQSLLKENGNPPAEFDVNRLTAFEVVVEESVAAEIHTAISVDTEVPPRIQLLIKSIGTNNLTLLELQHITGLLSMSRQNFAKIYVQPAIILNLITLEHPENPRHPKQKYCLTEQGLKILKQLSLQQEYVRGKRKGNN